MPCSPPWRSRRSRRVRNASTATASSAAPSGARTQLGALMSLEPGSAVPMSKLADTLRCDNSNVTGIVDRLEARGLVERRSDEHDRRVKMLVVTERGAQLRRRLVKRMSEPPPE